MTPKQEAPTDGKVRITQVRSGIGHPKTLRLTLRSLGLRHHQDSVIQQDSAALRGQINKVRHLVTVTRVEE
ncbi:MAG TPA: 50S ribosomal protein L30 [Gemmatimonadaceae bacterium]|nr:50S ribosomal protein L30 [Gemmatimonadaceae bacterium]